MVRCGVRQRALLTVVEDVSEGGDKTWVVVLSVLSIVCFVAVVGAVFVRYHR